MAIPSVIKLPQGDAIRFNLVCRDQNTDVISVATKTILYDDIVKMVQKIFTDPQQSPIKNYIMENDLKNLVDVDPVLQISTEIFKFLTLNDTVKTNYRSIGPLALLIIHKLSNARTPTFIGGYQLLPRGIVGITPPIGEGNVELPPEIIDSIFSTINQPNLSMRMNLVSYGGVHNFPGWFKVCMKYSSVFPTIIFKLAFKKYLSAENEKRPALLLMKRALSAGDIHGDMMDEVLEKGDQTIFDMVILERYSDHVTSSRQYPHIARLKNQRKDFLDSLFNRNIITDEEYKYHSNFIDELARWTSRSNDPIRVGAEVVINNIRLNLITEPFSISTKYAYDNIDKLMEFKKLSESDRELLSSMIVPSPVSDYFLKNTPFPDIDIDNDGGYLAKIILMLELDPRHYPTIFGGFDRGISKYQEKVFSLMKYTIHAGRNIYYSAHFDTSVLAVYIYIKWGETFYSLNKCIYELTPESSFDSILRFVETLPDMALLKQFSNITETIGDITTRLIELCFRKELDLSMDTEECLARREKIAIRIMKKLGTIDKMDSHYTTRVVSAFNVLKYKMDGN